jgi:hypothetical protein
MTASLDKAGDVRDEDRLDAAKIDAFLKEHVSGLQSFNNFRAAPPT